MTLKVLLDTNAYDLIEGVPGVLAMVERAIENGTIEVLMPRTVAMELHQRPQWYPGSFQVTHTGHHVARAGLMCAGDALGSGSAFDTHLGEGTSKHIPDALIADTATWIADWFVSNDKRSRNRLRNIYAESDISNKCREMDFREFVDRLEMLMAPSK